MTLGLITLAAFFILGLLTTTNGQPIAKALEDGLFLGIIFGLIGAVVGHFALSKKVEPIRDQNKMADVWRTKCEQVIAKAKFILKDDASAMSAIMNIENELKHTK